MIFEKYKRFFSFGCSYTEFIWPTWANVIHAEMPNAKHYNFGRSGSGNLMIAARVAEANKRFNFCDTDLVMIMWAPYCREDRWINGNWVTQGNIFNQSYYPQAWVKEFADPAGYFIRDCALIELTNSYISSLPCDSKILFSNNLDTIESAEKSELEYVKKLKTIYNTDDSTKSLTRYFNGRKIGHSYIWDNQLHYDGHPTPKEHYEYLCYLGYPLTVKAKTFAETETKKLTTDLTRKQIIDMFTENQKILNESYTLMF